ncbi:anti-sigma factor RsbA family regulatory protein [Dactylosporangium sp. CS-047395]|uniref:anti-sigma factor RsbA family regulatory protein n=1 Tax=Dactylosporangium sp. CS-047395 TaxID=3239936 RepID=UPI003D8A82D9
MRAGAPAGHRGFFHEAAFYRTDEEFLAILTPFLADGVAAGEPVVCAFGARRQDLLRDAIGADAGVVFMDGEQHYSRPATAIHRYRGLLADHVAAGADQIRIAGEVPHPGVGVPWDWWARYEAVINSAYDDFPLWGLCPYDVRNTPAEVLAQVRRTHPYIATPSGHRANPDFADPETFLRERRSTWNDPLEVTRPRAELTDPMPSEVRAAVIAAGGHSTISQPELRSLVLAATEVVTNALVHGAPPVEVRVWTAERRILVLVADAGPGPRNPVVGLRPVRTPTGGLGLWIAHQICAHVDLRHERGQFTVRLVAGQPDP